MHSIKKSILQSRKQIMTARKNMKSIIDVTGYNASEILLSYKNTFNKTDTTNYAYAYIMSFTKGVVAYKNINMEHVTKEIISTIFDIDFIINFIIDNKIFEPKAPIPLNIYDMYYRELELKQGLVIENGDVIFVNVS